MLGSNEDSVKSNSIKGYGSSCIRENLLECAKSSFLIRVKTNINMTNLYTFGDCHGGSMHGVEGELER